MSAFSRPPQYSREHGDSARLTESWVAQQLFGEQLEALVRMWDIARLFDIVPCGQVKGAGVLALSVSMMLMSNSAN